MQYIWHSSLACFISLFFYLIEGFLSFEPVLRAIMLCVIAFIKGSVVECMTHFRDELAFQNQELETTKEVF